MTETAGCLLSLTIWVTSLNVDRHFSRHFRRPFQAERCWSSLFIASVSIVPPCWWRFHSASSSFFRLNQLLQELGQRPGERGFRCWRCREIVRVVSVLWLLERAQPRSLLIWGRGKSATS